MEIVVRWKPPATMRLPGTVGAIWSRLSRLSARASARPSRSIATASSTPRIGTGRVACRLRAEARIVVVSAMPTTRTPGRSTSVSVSIREAADTR